MHREFTTKFTDKYLLAGGGAKLGKKTDHAHEHTQLHYRSVRQPLEEKTRSHKGITI